MTTCSSCSSEIAPGTRWCTICSTNVIDPSIGRLAPPIRRLAAYFLDLLIPLVSLFLILVVAGLGASTGTDTGGTVGVLLGVGLFIAYGIWALMLFAQGTTPGKRVLSLRVIKTDGKNAGFLTMLVREWIGKWISGMVLLLGFIWILLDREKQGWHDKLMSTYVIRQS